MNRALPVVLGAALCLGTAPAPLRADGEDDEREQRAEVEVIVTAERGPIERERTAAAVTVVTREEIARHPAMNLAELLHLVAGFRLSFAGGFGGSPILTPRGFFGGGEAEYAKLLIDGVPVGDAESGLVDWREVRAADVERIEILHGAASAVYGDAALGGVVAVFTRHASLGEAEAGAVVSAGSFGTRGAQAHGRAGLGPLQLGVAAADDRTGGFREHAAARESAADASVAWPLASSRLALSLSHAERDRQDPGTLTREAMERDPDGFDPAFRHDHDAGRRSRAALTHEVEREEAGLRTTLSGTLRSSEAVRTLYLAPGYPDTAHRSVDGGGWGLAVDGRRRAAWLGGELDLFAGVDVGRDAVDVVSRAVGEEGSAGGVTGEAASERTRVAAYASEGWQAHPRLRIVAGTRWDRIDDGDGRRHAAWSPRLGAVLALGPAEAPPLHVHLQLARAFKAPTLDQLRDPRPFPDGAGGTFTIANEELRPQRARTAELGARLVRGSLAVELAAYQSELDDEIDFDPVTFRYANIRESRHRGVEASADLDLGRVAPFVRYAWRAVEARSAEGAGRQLKNVPLHDLRAGLAAPLGERARLEVAVARLSGRWLDDENRVPLEDATTVDLRLAGGPLRGAERGGHGWEIRLDALNLLDERHVELGYLASGPDGSTEERLLPNAGRAFRLSLALRRGPAARRL